MPLSFEMMPAMLKRGGYKTHMLGKWCEAENHLISSRVDQVAQSQLTKHAGALTARCRCGGRHLGHFTQAHTPAGRGFDSFFGFLFGSASRGRWGH